MDSYDAALARLRSEPPGAPFYDAHPSFGLKPAEEEFPSVRRASDLGVAWLRRRRGDRLSAHEAFMEELLTWCVRGEQCRFVGVLPRRARRQIESAACGDVTYKNGAIEGQLNGAVASVVARLPIVRLLTYVDAKPCAIVDGGWDRVGVWLGPDELQELRPALNRAVPPTKPSPKRWDLGLLRARLVVASLTVERAASLLAGFGLIAIFGSDLANNWQRGGLMLGGILGTYTLAWLVRRLLRRFRPIL